MNGRAEAGVVNRLTWDMRYDPPVPPAGGGAAANAAGGGRGGRGGGGRGANAAGGRGGRGGAAAAEGTPPVTTSPSTGEAANAGGGSGAGLAGELNAEFGPEAAGAAGGGRGAGGGGGGGGGGGRGFGGAARGSLVDPGKYTITLTAGNAKDSMAITVEDDPRVQMSDADRAKKRETLKTLESLTKEAEEPRRKAAGMTTAMTNLLASWQAPNAPPVPEAVRKAVDDFNARLKTAAAVFEAAGGGRGGRGGGGGGGGAGPPSGYTPPPVTQKIARLVTLIDNYSAAPTSQQLADMREAQSELKAGEAEINTLWDDMPKLNKVMSDAGMQYFRVEMGGAAAAGGGRRGGN